MQHRHAILQACERRLEAAQIGGAFAFGSGAQSFSGAPFVGRPPGVEKQTGIVEHALAHWSRGPLVVFEPAPQLAGGQWHHGQHRQEAIGVLGIGARQRRHDPVGRPARQLAGADRRQRRIGQCRQQSQAPADPAHVAPAAARQVVLRQALTLHQLTQQQGFLDAGEPAILCPRQHAQQRFGQVARPLLNPGGVAAEPTQRGDAPIAVDQHSWVSARAGTTGNRHHDAGDDLATTLDGLGDPRHRLRLHETAAGKAQVQAVQVKIQTMAVHGAIATRAVRASL